MPDLKRILFFALFACQQNSIAGTIELDWTGCDSSRTAYVGDLADAYSQKTGIQIN